MHNSVLVSQESSDEAQAEIWADDVVDLDEWVHLKEAVWYLRFADLMKFLRTRSTEADGENIVHSKRYGHLRTVVWCFDSFALYNSLHTPSIGFQVEEKWVMVLP